MNQNQTWRNPGRVRRLGAMLSNSLTWSLSIYDIICVTQRYAEIKSNCSQNALTRWILNIHEVRTTKNKTADCSNLVLYNLFRQTLLDTNYSDWRLKTGDYTDNINGSFCWSGSRLDPNNSILWLHWRLRKDSFSKTDRQTQCGCEARI